MSSFLSLLIGLVCAGVGAELFVRGLLGLARWARVSAGIVATTVAAFATSSPEFSVAVRAAVSGHPEISLGDVLGSNVINIALILALALCHSPILSSRASVRRDFPVALLVPLVIGGLGLDGRLSRGDGVTLLVGFFAWLAVAIHSARQERRVTPPAVTGTQWMPVFARFAIGFALLLVSGYFIVRGAREIAAAYGVPEFVMGATVVAVGTSIPELATTMTSKLRGHDEIGLGTVLGSNIFNGLFIVGVAAVICPISVAPADVGLALAFGMVATVLIVPKREGVIPRWRGGILLALYVVFVVAMFLP